VVGSRKPCLVVGLSPYPRSFSAPLCQLPTAQSLDRGTIQSEPPLTLRETPAQGNPPTSLPVSPSLCLCLQAWL